jgi:hypothetical protein
MKITETDSNSSYFISDVRNISKQKSHYNYTGDASEKMRRLTVSLSPAQVVLQVLVRGVEHHASIEAGSIRETLVTKVLRPVEYVG